MKFEKDKIKIKKLNNPMIKQGRNGYIRYMKNLIYLRIKHLQYCKYVYDKDSKNELLKINTRLHKIINENTISYNVLPKLNNEKTDVDLKFIYHASKISKQYKIGIYIQLLLNGIICKYNDFVILFNKTTKELLKEDCRKIVTRYYTKTYFGWNSVINFSYDPHYNYISIYIDNHINDEIQINKNDLLMLGIEI